MSPAKTATPIDMPFGLWAGMCPRNRVLDGVQIPMGRGNLDGPRNHVLDAQVLRDVAMATIFVFLYMGCTLAIPGIYD